MIHRFRVFAQPTIKENSDYFAENKCKRKMLLTIRDS